MNELIQAYSQPVARYTSYPTVPQWENNHFTPGLWMKHVTRSFQTAGHNGIGIYIHLPYCESLCTYCGCNTRITVNHKVEEPYIHAVLNEWKMYVDAFKKPVLIKELHIGGGTPTFFSAENLKTLIQGILKTAEVAPGADFSFEGHPNNTTAEHLNVLKSLGFNRVSFGVQDLTKKVQTAINRIQPFENVKKVFEMARQSGYTSVNADLVYGLPFQTMDDLRFTVEQMLTLKPDRVAYYSYAHVPWKKPGQRKFTQEDLPSVNERFEMFSWIENEFGKNGYKSIGMDHFALESDPLSRACAEKKLHRNFMGYTCQNIPLLIGLGCSAISDGGTAYAQNRLTVEEYMTDINTKRLAVYKGHFLTPEDILLQTKIRDIMTNGSTCLSDIALPLLTEILTRLHSLEMNQLLSIDNECVYITQAGKRFLRNIAQCFDQRHFKQPTSNKMYSQSI